MAINHVATQQQEQIVTDILRILPPHRASQLVDFARFLEAQILAEELMQEATPEEIAADNKRWDALVSTPESQNLLANLAAEALNETTFPAPTALLQ